MAKNFSTILLMLILLLNLSSFMHTVFHIHSSPEVFCTAQYELNSAPHLEARHLPFAADKDCPVCEYELQNNSPEIIENFFCTVPQKQKTESFDIKSFDSAVIFFISSRAPPAV